MPGEPVNIICMKWGTRYPSRYVNILFRSIGRHLSRPFRFVCLTDDTAGLVEGIETLPFPENPGVTQARWPHVFLPGKRGYSDHPKQNSGWLSAETRLDDGPHLGSRIHLTSRKPTCQKQIPSTKSKFLAPELIRRNPARVPFTACRRSGLSSGSHGIPDSPNKASGDPHPQDVG